MLFNRRKPIVIGETYIFDVLGESDMSPTTSLVTVIKKAKHRKHYIVMSENTKEVFECPQDLLTPYSENVKVVRCQYCTTDFNEADLQFFDNVDFMLELLTDTANMFKESAKGDKESEENADKLNGMLSTLGKYNDLFRNKVRRYYDINQFKYELASRIKKSKLAKKLEDDAIEEIKHGTATIQQPQPPEQAMPSYFDTQEFQAFSERFNSNIVCLKRGMLTYDEFVANSIEIIQQSYPIDLTMAGNTLEYITIDDLEFILKNVTQTITPRSLMFLIAKNPLDKVSAICITPYDMANNKVVDIYYNYVRELYPDWDSNKRCSYKTKRRIAIIHLNLDDNQ